MHLPRDARALFFAHGFGASGQLANLLERCGQRERALTHALFQLVLGALQGGAETGVVIGFQQVIDRVHFKSPQGVFVVGRHEDHLRGHGQPVGHLESAEAGHADVDEGDVGAQRFDGHQRRGSVSGLGQDLELWP